MHNTTKINIKHIIIVIVAKCGAICDKLGSVFYKCGTCQSAARLGSTVASCRRMGWRGCIMKSEPPEAGNRARQSSRRDDAGIADLYRVPFLQ